MSIIVHSFDRSLPFYLSGPTPCPYLPDRIERKLFARLSGDPGKDNGINAALTRAGFRRSHDIVYRPACNSCNACVPVRIPVTAFRTTRSLRRIVKCNSDLSLQKTDTAITDEHYELFRLYQRARHPDSDMVQMTHVDFVALVKEETVDTHFYQLRAEAGSLLGGIIVDRVHDGLSAVYSFFKPDEPRRCLGTYLILALVNEARRQNLPYIYLGYLIASARKMAYKARFRPLQALGPEGWRFVQGA